MGMKVAGATATHSFLLPRPTASPIHVCPLSSRHMPSLHRSSPVVLRLLPPPRRARTIPRASCFDSDDEFSRKIRELALQFQLSTNDVISGDAALLMEDAAMNWHSVELPVSFGVISTKMQWNDGESAHCSVKKAFSFMVFIIRELHSFTLQMREFLFCKDLPGILARVHKEMHASFVWLFQQIFSQTPTLMVYVMILLANFTVHSMGSNDAIAAVSSRVGSLSASSESVSLMAMEDGGGKQSMFDSPSSSPWSCRISSSGSKTTSVGGLNGGGGKARPVAMGTGGEGRFPHADNYQGVLPDGASSHSSSFETSSKGEESVSGREPEEEEVCLWNSIVKEASNMQGSPTTHELVDHKTRLNLVSSVTAKIEADKYEDYAATELFYQNNLSKDPSNPLLLANYAQFLYLVSNDHDRAEEHFKRAIAAHPPDAESYNKYATFLWKAKNDLWAAEETFLGAISADPSNSFYAANYAHFLWNTGGEDTCFLLAPDQPSS